MGEKIIIVLLLLCMSIGIVSGPYLWMLSGEREVSGADEETEKTTEQITEERSQEETVIDDSMIRVLISNSTLGKYDHKTVTITSKQEYYVKTDSKTEKKKAGETTTLKYDQKKKGQTVMFSGTGQLEISSIRRAYGIPSYRGILKVHYGSSALTIINQLLLEEYLYAVIPSEMPVSYGSEALKVQAVCARSFAVKQKAGQKFRQYGADVDDSVSSQVYNNTRECEESIQAVLDTAGEVLTYKNEISIKENGGWRYKYGNMFYVRLVNQYLAVPNFSDATVQAIFNEALKYQGWKYVYGGSNPNTSFDCSGLTSWCYGKVGISLPRTAQAQYDATQHIPLSQAKAGDLVFFHSTYNAGTYVTHVGIYAGNNRMYHAGNPIGYADLTSSYWQQHLIGAGRVKTK